MSSTLIERFQMFTYLLICFYPTINYAVSQSNSASYEMLCDVTVDCAPQIPALITLQLSVTSDFQ
jgi:hypothetical protein